MSDIKPYDAFGPVPSHIPPSQPVRYWHNALLLGLVTFNLVYPLLLLLVHVVAGSPYLADTVWAGYSILLWAAGFGGPYPPALADYLELVKHPQAFTTGAGVAWLVAMVPTVIVFIWGARPITNMVHVSGYRLLMGKEAVREAKRMTEQMTGATKSVFNVELCPGLVFPKKVLSGHTLIAGGTGSGKGVIMKKYIHQLTAPPKSDKAIAKSIIYDPKGEFAPELPHAAIVSPYHMFSHAWDIGRDIRTPLHASLFAQCLIPEEGGGANRFFTEAARSLVTGVIVSLQNTYGTQWGWAHFAQLLNHDAEGLLPVLEKHYPKGMMSIADPNSTTSSSVIATLGAYTRIVDDLAMAWSGEDIYDKHGQVITNKDGSIRKRKLFSLADWLSDANTGPNHILVQGGTDPNLTRAYISAMVNVATVEIQSLKDNEQGRCLAFFLDELPSIGKIDFMSLVDKGRSKGVVVVMAYQDIAQLKEIYGDHIGDSLQSMVGTHIYCRMSQGATRAEIAKSFSSRYVASIEHGPNGRVNEHGRSVVYEEQLTRDLGFHKGKDYGPEKWGVNCIVTTGSSNPMLLKIPGKTYRQYRPGVVKAWWTLGPRNRVGSVIENVVEQREAVQAFSQDSKAFHKELPTLRKGGAILGLSPDDLDRVLGDMRPKFDDYDPKKRRAREVDGGFRRA